MERSKVLILASGGLDSSVLLALYSKLNYDINIMYVDYGNINALNEQVALAGLLNKFNIPKTKVNTVTLKMPFNDSMVTGNSNDPYVCMRNMILISLAVSKAEELDIPEVVLGLIDVDEPYRDSDSYFIANMNKVSAESCGVNVKAPLINLKKQQVYDLGKSLGVSLTDIFSCFTPVSDAPCGKCPACIDLANLED